MFSVDIIIFFNYLFYIFLNPCFSNCNMFSLVFCFVHYVYFTLWMWALLKKTIYKQYVSTLSFQTGVSPFTGNSSPAAADEAIYSEVKLGTTVCILVLVTVVIYFTDGYMGYKWV